MHDRLARLQARTAAACRPSARIRRSASGRPRARGRSARRRDRPAAPSGPRSWLSMRRLSWRSVPITNSPPAAFTSSCLAATSARIWAPRAAIVRLVLEACEFLAQPHVEIAAEFDVGAAAGHVGRDRHRAGCPRLAHDRRLLLVEARVQHRVRHAALGEQARTAPRSSRSRSCPPARAANACLCFGDQRRHRLVFLRGREIDLVVLVAACHRQIGRDLDHVELVDLGELVRLPSSPLRSCRTASDTDEK